AAPPDSPSFPTRRSSDLKRKGPFQRLNCLVLLLQLIVVSKGKVPVYGWKTGIGFGRLFPAVDRLRILSFVVPEVSQIIPGAGIVDRKSTRLNSSHVKIPY